MRSWTIAPRQWRSLAFKLLVGIGIASLAVAYQDKVPQIQGRGAGLVSSQSADLSQVTRLTGHTGAVNAVALADQGRWIVSAGSDGTLKIWNTGSGALVRTIELDEGPATALAVEDRRALTGHKGGAVVLWDLDRAEKLAVVQHRAPVSSLTLTGDPNRFFAASQDGAVSLFDVRSPNTPAPLGDDVEGGAQLMALARSRGLLVTAGRDRNIRLWRTDSMSLTRTWRTNTEGIAALDITSAGRTIATAGADGKVRLWTTSSSRVQRTLEAHQGRVTALAFAPNGGLLATAGEDGEVKVWNVRSSRGAPRALRGHTGPVRAVSFSADGQRLVSAGQDGAIRIWTTVASPRD
jgi:WD40 repeat protein